MNRLRKLAATIDQYMQGGIAEVETEEGRRAARRAFMVRDHHFLRLFWSNFAKVGSGAYRSNQPDQKRLAEYKALGVRTVLNLRGDWPTPFYWVTKVACEALDLELVSVRMSATTAPPREAMLAVFDVFDKAERDLLIHCKSGADRTGLVSVFYLIDQCGESLATARRHLSFRYVHVRWSKAGILDLLLDDFAKVEGKKPLRDWLREDYDAADLNRRFAGRRRR